MLRMLGLNKILMRVKRVKIHLRVHRFYDACPTFRGRISCAEGLHQEYAFVKGQRKFLPVEFVLELNRTRLSLLTKTVWRAQKFYYAFHFLPGAGLFGIQISAFIFTDTPAHKVTLMK